MGDITRGDKERSYHCLSYDNGSPRSRGAALRGANKRPTAPRRSTRPAQGISRRGAVCWRAPPLSPDEASQPRRCATSDRRRPGKRATEPELRLAAKANPGRGDAGQCDVLGFHGPSSSVVRRLRVAALRCTLTLRPLSCQAYIVSMRRRVMANQYDLI